MKTAAHRHTAQGYVACCTSSATFALVTDRHAGVGVQASGLQSEQQGRVR